MINIKHGEVTYSIKNTTTELSVKEFEEVSSKLNDKTATIMDKWSEVFIYLGVPEEVVDDMEAASFIQIIKEFNFGEKINNDIQKEIIVDGVTYVAFDTEFKLNVKDLALIEGAIKKNQSRYLGELLAIVYKRIDADRTINYDKAHIHFKAELFRKEVTTDVVIPLLDYLSKNIATNYEYLSPTT